MTLFLNQLSNGATRTEAVLPFFAAAASRRREKTKKRQNEPTMSLKKNDL
jgi:hypothetical protein